MLSLLSEPCRVTLDHHDETPGKPYALIGFQVHQDESLHPVIVDLEDGRISVVGIYDIQVDVSKLKGNLGLPKRQIPVPKIVRGKT